MKANALHSQTVAAIQTTLPVTDKHILDIWKCNPAILP